MTTSSTTSSSAAPVTGGPDFSTAQLCAGDSLSNLIHKLCHEVDNPLTAIISLATVIQRADWAADQSLVEKLPSYAHAIGKEAWRVSNLMERLLLIASTRRESGSTAKVTDVLFEALAHVRDNDEFEKIAIDVDVPEGSAEIAIGEEQLLLLFTELLSNAHEAVTRELKDRSEADSVTPLSLKLEQRDGTVSFRITSVTSKRTGPHLSQFFEPFVSGEPSSKNAGLGLTVSWAIVERAGGKIWLEERGVDGRFEFSANVLLPLHAGQSASADPQFTSAQEREAVYQEEASILIVEDEPMVASAMSKILELSLKDRVEVAAEIVGGPEALERLKSGESFDVVLCDLNLKNMSGRHIYDAVRKVSPEQAERFAFLTGDSLTPETSTYLKSSGRPFLFKPFEPKQLVELVLSILAKRSN